MKRQFAFWTGLVALAMTSVAAPAHADGPLSLGVRAVDFVPTDGDGAWKGGVQARLRLPLFFAVEGSVDYRRDTFAGTTARDWPVQLSGLLYLPKIIVVQPFLLAGGGWYDTSVNGPNGYSGTQNRFGPHVGAGTEINLNSNWFVDATYRFVWLNEVHTVNAQGAGEDLRDRGHMVTIGLNYRI